MNSRTTRLALGLGAFLSLFAARIAVACEYCASYSSVCTSYSQQCTSYTQVCSSYQTQCTQYDDYGNCTQEEDVCVAYTNECSSYQDVCNSYEQVCNSYSYDENVTVTGTVKAPNGGPGLGGLSVTVRDLNYPSNAITQSTSANGSYRITLDSYDDANGNVTLQTCVQGGAGYIPGQSCQSFTLADQCTFPSKQLDFTMVPPPTGHLDVAGPTSFAGWALDPQNGNVATRIDFYLDQPAGQGGSYVGSTTANLPRPDINQATGYPGNHGFSWAIPSSIKGPHTLYAYVIAIDNRTNALLGAGALSGNLRGVAHAIAVGTDAGVGSDVRVFDANGDQLVFEASPFGGFGGGTRVALGDVDHDGVLDIIAAAGPGGGPVVTVYSGATGQVIRQFFAFGGSYRGGLYVAAGDIDGDGYADIIVGADAGGGPRVTVFSGRTQGIIRDFFAYEPSYTGGVRVAAGDVDRDGYADIITSTGPGGGPHIEAFSGRTGGVIRSFFAFEPSFTGGGFVAAGDIDGDGYADIIVGAGPGAGPRVVAFSGATGAMIQSFFAYAPNVNSGVRVGGVVLGGRTHIATVPASGGGPHVAVFNAYYQLVQSFFAYAPSMTSGLFVSGY